MKAIRRVLALAVALGLVSGAMLFPLGASAELSNFTIVNNGFEDIRTNEGTNWPVKWDGWPSAGDKVGGVCTYQVTAEQKHSGDKSLKFTLSSIFNQAAYEYYLKKDNPFDFDGEYTVTCWVKLVNVSAGSDGVSMGVQRKDTGGNRHDIISAPVSGTSDWQKLHVQVKKVNGVVIDQFDFIVKIGVGSGTVYVDDFDIEPYNSAYDTVSSTPATTTNNNNNNTTTNNGTAATTSSKPATTGSTAVSQAASKAQGAVNSETASLETGSEAIANASSAGVSETSTKTAGGHGVLIAVIIVAAVIVAGAVVACILILRKKPKQPAA